MIPWLLVIVLSIVAALLALALTELRKQHDALLAEYRHLPRGLPPST
jgi:hypothetical protein